MTDIDTWEWFGNRTFHHSQFEPPAKLRAAKERLGLTVSVCLPTRDEAATVGGIVRSLRRNLLEQLENEPALADPRDPDQRDNL